MQFSLDRQTHFALHSIKTGIPTFILLTRSLLARIFLGNENIWGKNFKTRSVILVLEIEFQKKFFADATGIITYL